MTSWMSLYALTAALGALAVGEVDKTVEPLEQRLLAMLSATAQARSLTLRFCSLDLTF